MRLIDADKLKEVFTLPKEYTDKKDESFYHVSFPIIRATIDNAPTVDAVPVVRCKDCRYYHIYWESNGYTKKGYGACDWINDNSVREDHFCSWGERREDGKAD